MRPEAVVALLAEPARLRTFSAVVLGATSLPSAASAAGVPTKEAATALRRLTSGGLVEEVDGELRATTEDFKEIARDSRPPAAEPERHGYADAEVESLLRTFVRNDRLVRLPSRWERRRVVLQHLAHRTFEESTTYLERAVNDRLRVWCEAAPVDHVTVRRYLVDFRLLGREDGRYWLRTDVHPAL